MSLLLSRNRRSDGSGHSPGDRGDRWNLVTDTPAPGSKASRMTPTPWPTLEKHSTSSYAPPALCKSRSYLVVHAFKTGDQHASRGQVGPSQDSHYPEPADSPWHPTAKTARRHQVCRSPSNLCYPQVSAWNLQYHYTRRLGKELKGYCWRAIGNLLASADSLILTYSHLLTQSRSFQPKTYLLNVLGSERRSSSVAYRNQASGSTDDPLGLDPSLRSYSAGPELAPLVCSSPVY